MEVYNYSELLEVMPEMYKTKRNTWHKSKFFKPYYFWNAEDKEIETMFPTMYAKLRDLRKASKDLFGISGTIIKTIPRRA